jgi:anti-anti-sigma factor
MKGEVFQIKPSGNDAASLKKILMWKKPVINENVAELQQLFDEAIKNEKKEIILDCKDIPFVDSAGLELLLTTDERLRKKGGGLKLVALNSLFAEILVATRIRNVLRVYKDIHQAIRSTS